VEAMSLIVELARPPFLVVPDDPDTAPQNSAAINAAIAAHAGKGAVLLLPPGEIYCDRAGSSWSIRVPPGASRVSLRGAGMFATMLVQHGAGVHDAGWDLLVLDSCSDVEISELGLRQGATQQPWGHGERNALIAVVAATQRCRNLVLEHVYFGPCIGEALRVAGDAPGTCCEHVRIASFILDTGHPHGAGGAGLGSRAGVSLRGGVRKLELSHGFLRGARGSLLEVESGAGGALEDLLLHHLVLDNAGGQGPTAVHLAGSPGAPIERLIASDVTVIDGNVSAALTRGALISGLTIRTSRDAPAALAGKPLLDWAQAHEGSTISNLTLERGAGSPPGPLVSVVPAGRAAGTLDVVAGVALVDGETFTIGDGATFATFEFDSDGQVTPGHVAVPFAPHATTLQVRDAIIAAVNAEHDLQVTASASTLPVQAHVVALTNDHYGRHGNAPLTTTVAHGAFVAAGMLGGIGESVDVRFSGGRWWTEVGPGPGKRYVEVRGSRRLTIEGVHLQLGAVGANEYGFGFRSIGDIHGPTLSNIRIESVTPTFGFPGAKLVAAASFAATDGGAITDVRVTGVRAPGACTAGVLLDRNGGASIDASPVIQGCDFAGASNAWLAINEAVDETFPIVAGNRGGRTWQVGTADPSAISSAVQGSRYTRQAGDGTTEWLKQSGTGSSGWALLPSGIERRTSDGAAALDRQVTYLSGAGVRITLGDHTTDGYIKHFVITGGTGELAPASLADGAEHVIAWTGAASFSLIWDAAAAAWRVLGAPRGATVG